MHIRLVAALATVLVLTLAGCSKKEVESRSTACDRDCLIEVTKTYLSALDALLQRNYDVSPLKDAVPSAINANVDLSE